MAGNLPAVGRLPAIDTPKLPGVVRLVSRSIGIV